MKICCVLVFASVLWEAKGYPYAYPYYGANVDSSEFIDINILIKKVYLNQISFINYLLHTNKLQNILYFPALLDRRHSKMLISVS